MIRNYNGNINRTVMRDLRKLCEVKTRKERNLFEAFNQKCEIFVYENFDPSTDYFDEKSNAVIMKSEAEIKEYLKKDLLKRVEGYLAHRKPAEDHLLCALIEFIKENSRFPEKDEMRQLEKNAEAERVAALPSDTVTAPKEITEKDMAKEILELAVEIMEDRRENNPEDIFVSDETYLEHLSIETNKFYVAITRDIRHGCKDFRDYKCVISMKDCRNVANIIIEYDCDGTLCITAEDFWDDVIDKPVTKYMITIHKRIVKIAKEAGIEFTSEIDYEKFQVA